MCPLCISSAALAAAGATSGAGALAVVASKWRTLQGWFSSLLTRLNLRP
jgi:hypothetical protein